MNKFYFLILAFAFSILLINSSLVIAPSSSSSYVTSAGYTKGGSGCLSVWAPNQIECFGGGASWFCDNQGYWWTKGCTDYCNPSTGQCEVWLHILIMNDSGTVCAKVPNKDKQCTSTTKSLMKVIFNIGDYVEIQATPSSGYVFTEYVFTEFADGSKSSTTQNPYAKTYTMGRAVYVNFKSISTPTPTPTPSGSCNGKCGVYSSSASCQCDAACVKYNDCCSDYQSVCGGSTNVTPSPTPTPNATPSGTCTVALCGKKNTAAGCWCDKSCASLGDCCLGFNYNSLCTSGGPTPTPISTCTKDLCDKQAPSGCWCDDACKSLGDCCAGFNYDTLCK